MSGWIKIHRKLLDWEWYSDINCRVLFLHCLLLANFEDKKWRGSDVKRGSFISSLSNLSQSSGLTIQQVRTALSKLNSTSEITSKGHAEYTVFTVVKYNEYQEINTENNKRSTRKQQGSNKLSTTTKEEEEYKEDKELKNIDIPTFDEFFTYAKENKPEVSEQLVKLKYQAWVANDWADGNGKKVVNWKTKLLNTLPYIDTVKQHKPKLSF